MPRRSPTVEGPLHMGVVELPSHAPSATPPPGKSTQCAVPPPLAGSLASLDVQPFSTHASYEGAPPPGKMVCLLMSRPGRESPELWNVMPARDQMLVRKQRRLAFTGTKEKAQLNVLHSDQDMDTRLATLEMHVALPETPVPTPWRVFSLQCPPSS